MSGGKISASRAKARRVATVAAMAGHPEAAPIVPEVPDFLVDPAPVATPATPVVSAAIPPQAMVMGHSTLGAQKRPHAAWIVVLRAPFRAVAWALDYRDDKGDPSLVKMLALAFGLVALRDMWAGGVNAANTTLAGIALSAAFGRSVWMAWLNRFTWSNTTHGETKITGSLKDVADIVHRRDPAKGIDPPDDHPLDAAAERARLLEEAKAR